MARKVLAGTVWLVLARHGRQGMTRLRWAGKVRSVKAAQRRTGPAWHGEAGPAWYCKEGEAGLERLVWAGSGSFGT